MSCNSPILAYYSKHLNESGKRSLVFTPRNRYLGSDPEFSASITVPCNKCLGCKADSSLMWSIRSYHESTLHEQNCFITLTYDEEHFPDDGKISKRDLQLFFKRLRKSLGDVPIRYIACGEYGERTRRPHYHAILFGKDWLEGSVSVKDDMYTNQSLVDAWGKGIVAIAPVNMSSICYVCGYVTKKVGASDTFSLMSRKPGIGHNWLDMYSDDIVRTGVVSIEGRQYQVPRRYLQWGEEILKDVISDRKKFAREFARNTTPEARFYQGVGRERNLKQKIKSKQEKL